MFRFTPRQIEIFLAVCRVQSFRKASESLRISQAAVSEQMRSLELQLGGTLFQRQAGRSIGLTAEGERFREGASAFAQNGRALGQLFRSSAPQRIRTFMGVFLLNEFVRPALSRFFLENPDITLDFSQAITGSDLNDHIAKGLIDCALLSRPETEPLGDFEAIYAENAFIYASRELRDAAQRDGLESIPFILWDIPPLNRADQLRMLASVGVFQPRVHSEVQHHDVAADLAAGGAGGVLMLRSTAQRLDRENRLVPLVQAGKWERRLYLSLTLDRHVRDRLAIFFRETVGG